MLAIRRQHSTPIGVYVLQSLTRVETLQYVGMFRHCLLSSVMGSLSDKCGEGTTSRLSPRVSLVVSERLRWTGLVDCRRLVDFAYVLKAVTGAAVDRRRTDPEVGGAKLSGADVQMTATTNWRGPVTVDFADVNADILGGW